MKRKIQNVTAPSKIMKKTPTNTYINELEEIKLKHSQEKENVQDLDLFSSQSPDDTLHTSLNSESQENELFLDQEVHISETSDLQLDISDSELIEFLMEYKNITNLYDWQQEILNLHLTNSLLISVPTSGGKSFIAEFHLLKSLSAGTSSMLILPYISLIEEYSASMVRYQEEIGFFMEAIYSNHGSLTNLPSDVPYLFITTIEKSNAVLNFCTQNHVELGVVVIDEFHMIGEQSRGEWLEMLIIKLNLFKIRILGISATFVNLGEFAKWMDATLYEGTHRPIPLYSYFKFGNGIYTHSNGEFELKRELSMDNLYELCKEVLMDSTLIFCATKKQCESTSLLLLEDAKKSPFLENLDDLGIQDDILKQTIPFGIAFHHSGLSKQDRDLVETMFKQDRIKILVATSTLAAGVNLPAKRVIFKTPYISDQLLTHSKYTQMCGRAGRAGYHTFGESVLCCKKQEAITILGSIDRIHSKMTSSGLQRLTLELLQSKSLPSSIKTFDGSVYTAPILSQLMHMDYIDRNGQMNKLGEAILESHFGLEEIHVLYSEWNRALDDGIIFKDALHLNYLICAPIEEVQWNNLFSTINGFDDVKSGILKRCKIDTNYIMQKAMSRGYKSQNDDLVEESRCKRLWNAILLNDTHSWIPRGNHENLIQTSLMRSSMMMKFCEKICWNYLKVVIKEWTSMIGGN